MSSALHFHAIDPEQTWPLRHAVLRAGRPLDACRWNGDESSSTHHYGLSTGDEIVAIGSLYHRPHDLVADARAWQLRGMAVAPDRARQGLGSRLLIAMLAACRDQLDGTIMWCNARITAAPFYQKHAFRILTDVFDIPGVGPHVVMCRSLADDSRPA